MKTLLSAAIVSFFYGQALAQDDLLSLLDSAGTPAEISYTYATFKGTRIINLQSIENPAPGELRFLISHRFGQLNSGAYNLWGLDDATIRMAFEYGVNERLAAGIARNSMNKTYDGFLKYKLLRQSTGSRNMPLSLVLLATAGLNTLDRPAASEPGFSNRLTYTWQALIGRKFSEGFSLELAPTYVHRNLVLTRQDENDVLALGVAARQKLSQRLSVTAEYLYLLPGRTADSFYNSLSVGVDIETGGHVFQLHLTNSRGMTEQYYVPETFGSWTDGGIYFGFNIYRSFQLR